MSLPLLLLLSSLTYQAHAEPVRISLLVTTDLHGNIYPYDYFTGRPADRGLAKIATLIRRQRAENPNSLLIDCGDTIQGAPLEGVHQNAVRTSQTSPLPDPRLQDPMMLAMNALQYDAMAVGNHEYNFGLRNFTIARKTAKFPWLSANTTSTGVFSPPLAPYLVKTVAGVKIAIIGITTPAVPGWEKPENIQGLKFLPAVQAVAAAVAKLKATVKPDLIIVAAHAGLDRDLKTGAVRSTETPGENPIHDIATQVPSIDAIVFGHTHAQLDQHTINGVLLHQPKNWGISLGQVDFTLEKQGASFRVTSKSAKIIPVTSAVPADDAILTLAKPYHDNAEKYLQTPVASSPAELDAVLARVQDSPLIDAIHQVQLHYGKADVSLTALFNARVRFPKGPITVRQIAALYVYDNELYTIQGNGKMLREALENAARYYNSCPTPACDSGSLLNRAVIGFNYDMAQGVNYSIDLTQPPGSRIANLTFRGQPLADSTPLKIAINNYRAAGSAGYSMFRNAPVLYKSGTEIRDLIIEYFTTHKLLPEKADNNWQIVPAPARARLLSEAQAEATRPANQ